MDESMNMIEKVARASFAYWAKQKSRDFKFENMPSYEMEFALGHAKAAIAAMREPSEDVIVAGAMIMPDYDPGNDDILRCWQACIDAALKEE